MGRSIRSAKAAGASFERLVADFLQDRLNEPTIDRLVKTGNKDRGDVGNVRDSLGNLIAVECKNVNHLDLPLWNRQARVEAENYGALVGVAIHKRHGKARPEDQWVTMDLDSFATLLAGERPA